MLFSEVYGTYYNVLAKLLDQAVNGTLTQESMNAIIREKGFEESILTIPEVLESQTWPLLKDNLTTPLQHKPTMPLTTLQKQWLKALLSDPRIKLFDPPMDGLEDVEPLFTSADYYIYDQYNDGDPFEDEQYIKNFRIVLEAIRKGTQIKFEMINRKGNMMFVRCRPLRLEYSEKDDKFRVVTAGWRAVSTVNLAKVRSCAHDIGYRRVSGREKTVAHDTITVKIRDERNAMERFMLHFAHFEKQAEKLDKKHYLVKIKYAHDDESEMVIRILSFGPMIEVLEPEPFRKLVIEKLEKQLSCGLK